MVAKQMAAKSRRNILKMDTVKYFLTRKQMPDQ